MNFEAFIEEKEKNQWKVHGIQVRRFEGCFEYGDCNTRFPLYSATKSFVSTAVGIAVGEGRFSIEKSLYEYVSPLIPALVSKEKRELAKKISIERLMTMSVQELPFRPEGENWLEGCLNSLPEDTENTSFHYSGAATYLVCVALQNALSEHIISFLRPRFFEPLGIEMPEYQDSPQGIFYGATGMKLSVHELSKLGELYLLKGCYQGKQLLSKAWVEKATSVHTDCREGGYGYFIWKFFDGFRISGKWGQRCIVMPEQGLVITYLSDMPEGSEEVTKAVQKYLF